MRAAAKVAGIRVASGARRGAGEGARPATAIVSSSSSSEEVKSSGVLSASQNSAIESAAVQRPCWELDDWEFAGGVGDDVVKPSGEPMPRLVFGGAPTLQEAKEATDELKDALEKLYPTSPHSIEGGDSLLPVHQYPFSLLSKPDYVETKDCVTSEKTAVSVPNNALKAFRLLNESPAAQNVVASIASDPNVWHAVLQNEALAEFLESQKSTNSFPDTDPVKNGSVADAEFTDNESPKSVDEFSDSEKSADSGNGFMGFVQGIKTTVKDMMTNLSDYFQSIFGGPSEEKDYGGADGNAKSTFAEKATGASFLGLAVMVIMVVVLKRG